MVPLYHFQFMVVSITLCLVRLQFHCLILASLSLCAALLAHEYGLANQRCTLMKSFAVIEDQMQQQWNRTCNFLGGVKGVCFSRPSLFIHDHKFLLPFHKRSIYFVHKHQNQVFRMTMYLRMIGYDLKIAIYGEKFCLSQRLIQLTSFAAAPVRWNNMTVMLF